MYYPKCAVCGQTEKNVQLHNFPRNSRRRANWIDAMNLKECDLFPRSRICCRHFTVKSYSYEGSRFLNRNAIPTLYPLSSHKEDTISIDLDDADLNPVSETNITVQIDPFSVLPSTEETQSQTILSNNTDIATTPVPSFLDRNHSISNRPNGKWRTFKRHKSYFIKNTVRARKEKKLKKVLKNSKKQILQKNKASQRSKYKLVLRKSYGHKETLRDKNKIKTIEKSHVVSSKENTSPPAQISSTDVEEMIPKNIIDTLLPLNDNTVSEDISILLPSITINDKVEDSVDPSKHDIDFVSNPSSTISKDFKCNLDLECWVEDLEPCQLALHRNRKQREEALQIQISNLIKTCESGLVAKYEHTTAIEVFENTQNMIKVKCTPVDPPPCTESISPLLPTQTYKQENISLICSSKQQSTYSDIQLPMGRLKNVISDKKITNEIPPTLGSTLNKKPLVQSPLITLPRESRNSILSNKSQGASSELSMYKTYFRKSLKKSTSIASNEKTTEENMSTKTKNVYGNTSNIVGHFSPMLDRIGPLLTVAASPYLRANNSNDDISELDSKIKDALSYKPAEFIDWLMKLGLIKSQQSCAMHCLNNLTLSKDSDPTKFQHSGGYIWTSNCCPQKITSVFSGSIFETAPHPPTTILKLLYHWACQTDISEVTKLVNVNHIYVKGMYTWLRAVCTIATFSHIRMLGGGDSIVEVGLISLEAAQEDDGKHFKVEVLGVLEKASNLIRLKAFKFNSEKNRIIKCIQVLQPLENWVHLNSIIAIDHSLVKNALHYFGFTNVIQIENENKNLMDYLKNVVAKMFQNTLSLLSLQIFQQFLDELVWREWFGTNSTLAFNNLVGHIAEQTRFDFGPSLIVTLNRVASNPFKISFLKKNVVSARTSVDQSQLAASKHVKTEILKRKRFLREEQNAKSSKLVPINATSNNECKNKTKPLAPTKNIHSSFEDNNDITGHEKTGNKSTAFQRYEIQNKTLEMKTYVKKIKRRLSADLENNTKVNKIDCETTPNSMKNISFKELNTYRDQELGYVKAEPPYNNPNEEN